MRVPMWLTDSLLIPSKLEALPDRLASGALPSLANPVGCAGDGRRTDLRCLQHCPGL